MKFRRGPNIPMPSSATLLVLMLLSVLLSIVGTIDYADALTMDAVAKIDRVYRIRKADEIERAYEKRLEFFHFKPLRCPSRARIHSGLWDYSGWVITQADGANPRRHCLYRKEM